MSNQRYMCILRNQGVGCNESASASDMEATFEKYQQWQQKFSSNIVDNDGQSLSKVHTATIETEQMSSVNFLFDKPSCLATV